MSKLFPRDNMETAYVHLRNIQVELAKAREAEREAKAALKKVILEDGAHHFLKLDMTKIRRNYFTCPACGNYPKPPENPL